MRKYIAEAVGTFGLVFAGTGAIVIDEVTGAAYRMSESRSLLDWWSWR
jgi:glycerol uptake facilitator-like aquaporin